MSTAELPRSQATHYFSVYSLRISIIERTYEDTQFNLGSRHILEEHLVDAPDEVGLLLEQFVQEDTLDSAIR